MAKVRNAIAWVRAHKVQVSILSFVGIGMAEQYVPGFPADDAARMVGAMLGMV